MTRKEKTEELFKKHSPTFRIKKVDDPFFTLKSAYFISGKQGKYIQLFESELGKDKDIYMEFVKKDLSPDLNDRPLIKLQYNPFYKEEYDIEHKTTDEGKEYSVFIVPVSELRVVLTNGTEVSYADYQSGVTVDRQQTLFPDFEEEFGSKLDTDISNEEIADAPLSDITIRDLAAIMLMKPVSARPWLNELIKQTKSEI
jgi:hypothetical protein